MVTDTTAQRQLMLEALAVLHEVEQLLVRVHRGHAVPSEIHHARARVREMITKL